MTTMIVALVVGSVAAVIGVVVIQSVLDGATTTSWSPGTIALTFLLPLVLAAGAIIGVLKGAGRL